MSIKLLICALFGHRFNEFGRQSEEYSGRRYIIRQEKKCDRCGLSDVDISGGIGLYNLKYGGTLKQGRIIEDMEVPK